MKRLTSNNAFEMSAVQLALNQVYIKDGWAQYQNGPEDDLSVCDLIRAAAEALGVELPMLNDDALSDLMADWLQYGAEEPEGVLAILYRALCAMAELRDKLSRYEDTGLEPEEITTEPYGCVFYCNRKCNLDGDWCAEGPGCLHEINAGAANHLLELAQAEKEGRMVVLPCKKGDTLWSLYDYPVYGISKIVVTAVSTIDGITVINTDDYGEMSAKDIGDSVFWTREEAEAALKKWGGADNEAEKGD